MAEAITTRCCIAGGGPAGMMLGFLLARAGIDVTVLEKHKDFLRDFRGDTIHPSTLELMHELGLLDEFLKLPHQEGRQPRIPDRRRTAADGGLQPSAGALQIRRADAAVGLPQFPGRQGQALSVVSSADAGRGEGADRAGRPRRRCSRAKTPGGDVEIRASLVVGCDGRHSTVRERAGFTVEDIGAPIDVLWFRLSRRNSDTEDTGGHIEAGKMMVMLNRGDYWQCAYVIPKGGIETVKREGLAKFRERVVELSPFLSDRIDEIKSFDDVKLLTVAIDRLRQWHKPGLLCIGDAAHAMSPVGGVGVNLAVQDAVAAANILAEPLRAGAVTSAHLAAVQARRDLPDAGYPAHAGDRAGSTAVAGAQGQRAAEAAAVAATDAVAADPAPHSGADCRPRRPPRARRDAGARFSGNPPA